MTMAPPKRQRYGAGLVWIVAVVAVLAMTAYAVGRWL